MTSARVDEALLALASAGDGRLDPAVSLLLGAALRGLAPGRCAPSEPTRAAPFWAIVRVLKRVLGGDILWEGRPAFLTRAILRDLTAELDEILAVRGPLAGPTLDGDERALRFAVCVELNELVDRVSGPALPMGDASYLVHRWSGTPSDPELGKVGEIRACLALRSRECAVFVLDTSGGTRYVKASPGTLIIYHTSTALVRLQDLDGGEALCAVTCGFLSSKLPPRRPPFVRTPHVVRERMLELAGVARGDLVFDLGCGDGALLRAAARRGARAVGIELDATLAERARMIAPPGVEIRAGDMRAADLRDAAAVLLFLNPECNESLRAKLESELRLGSCVVTHMWPVKGWTPSSVECVRTSEAGMLHRLFAYRR